MVLLERDEPLSEITRLLGRANEGIGSFVAVTGEAGVGKTSLLRATAMDTPDRVWWGSCDALATPRPLGPLHDMAPEAGIGSMLAESPSPYDIYSDVLDRLRGTIRPTLMVIEDVHWADEATLDLLRYLGRRIDTTKAVLAVSYRDDEVGRDHPLRQVIADIPGVVRCPIRPLSREAVAELTGPDRAEEIHELTGGNPFFVTEIVATDERIPPSVADATLSRLSRLPASARNLVEVMAVSPEPVPVRVAMRLSDATAIDTQLVTDAGLLVAEDTNLAFRHELGRQAVYHYMGLGERALNHEKFVLHELELDQPDAVVVAHHAHAAGLDDIVLTWAPLAASDAERRRARREAIRFYDLLLEACPPEDRPRFWLDRSALLRSVGRRGEATSDAERAVAALRESGDRNELATALISLSTALSDEIDARSSGTALVEAIDVLGEDGDLSRRVTAWRQLAFFAMLNRRRTEALESLDTASRLAEEFADETATSLVGLVAAYVDMMSGYETVGYARIVEIYDTMPPGQAQVSAIVNLGSGCGEVRMYERAIEHLGAAIEVASSFDEDRVVGYARAWLARVALETGRWDEAVDLAEAVETEWVPWYVALTAAGALGRTKIRRGLSEGLTELDRWLEFGTGSYFQHRWPLHVGIAEHHWLNGDMETAASVLADVYVEAMATDTPWGRGEVAYWYHLAGGIDEPPEGVAEPYRLHMEGRWVEAAAAWERLGCPYEQALALAHGDEGMMLAGLEMLEGLGATPAAAWLRRRMRTVGVESIPRGPRRATLANPSGLTARQTEVLGLVVDGMTNGDIAETLVISKRTVEHHVSTIMSKLGVSSRPELIVAGRNL